MAFAETLHIFIGENNHFFTLRQSYQIAVSYGVNANGQYDVRLQTKYAHLCNLSQDYEEAREKAVAYSEQLGMPLVAAATSESQMREIQRRTQEDIAAAKQEQDRIQNERIAAELARQEEYFNNWKHDAQVMLANGEFPHDAGQYSGQPLEFMPVSYFQWILTMRDVSVPHHKFAWIASVIEQHVDIPAEVESQYVGEIKGRIELEVQLQRTSTFDGAYGRTYIYSMMDRSGNKLVWFSSTAALYQKNGWFKLKATVKGHDIYRDSKQTIITRAKVI